MFSAQVSDAIRLPTGYCIFMRAVIYPDKKMEGECRLIIRRNYIKNRSQIPYGIFGGCLLRTIYR